MYEVYEKLGKGNVILQLRKGDKGVSGFDFKISMERLKYIRMLRRMLERERDKRTNKPVVVSRDFSSLRSETWGFH
jgi:hypothetical protein